MPRARNIKPGFFKNEELVELPFEARLLFIGLWMIADREGRLEDRPKRIKIEVFPADDVDISRNLDLLSQRGFLIRYEQDGVGYIQICNFVKHQQPHYKEVASTIPPPDGWEDSGVTPGGVPEEIRRKVMDRDGECVACGSKEQLTLDHKVPRSRGGSHDESNLQVLCRKCNSSKNNREASSAQGHTDVGSWSAHGRPSNPGPAHLIPESLDLIPESPSLKEESKENTSSAAPTEPEPNPEPLAEGFEEFWAAYPKKVDKKNALAAWKAKKLNGHAQEVIEHVRRRVTQDKTWLDGFVMSPKRFLREERWNDQYTQALSHREKVLRALEDRHNPVIEGRLTNGQ